MNRHFTPDKHIRIREYHENNNKPRKTENQPTPEIYAVTLFRPRQTDIIRDWQVSTNQDMNLEKFKTLLENKIGKEVKVSEALFGGLDIHLMESGIMWRDVIKYTKEALEELTE